jgi:hypothetical protein
MSVDHSNSTILNSPSAGYGVTTSDTQEDTSTGCSLIAELESYIRSYVTLAETSYALVIALWLVAIGEMKPKIPREIIAGDAWHKVCGKSDVVQTPTSHQPKRRPVQRIPVLVSCRSDDDRDHPGHGAVTA